MPAKQQALQTRALIQPSLKRQTTSLNQLSSVHHPIHYCVYSKTSWSLPISSLQCSDNPQSRVRVHSSLRLNMELPGLWRYEGWLPSQGSPTGNQLGERAILTVYLNHFLHWMHCISICSLLENLFWKRVKLERERKNKGTLSQTREQALGMI